MLLQYILSRKSTDEICYILSRLLSLQSLRSFTLTAHLGLDTKFSSKIRDLYLDVIKFTVEKSSFTCSSFSLTKSSVGI